MGKKEKQKVAEMSSFLKSRGWNQLDADPRYWWISNWDPNKSGKCVKTVAQAYKIQMKLDAKGHSKPIGMDEKVELD